MYEINFLKNSMSVLYENMTFPRFQYILENIESEKYVMAFTASSDGQPVGLILAEVRKQDHSAELLSLFVETSYRCQGVATQLVCHLEKELKVRDCKEIDLSYMTGNQGNLALERVLQKCHWTEPEPKMIACKGRIADNGVQMPWVTKHNYFHGSYSLFPWREITKEEKKAIEQQRQYIPEDLFPLRYEEDMEPLNSLGLRYQGEVVGWLISHRIAPDTIRYTCNFIRQDLQKIGRNLGLMAEAIKLQFEAKIPYIIWTTPIHHRAMVEFTKKRISPYLIYLREIKESHKLIA